MKIEKIELTVNGDLGVDLPNWSKTEPMIGISDLLDGIVIGFRKRERTVEVPLRTVVPIPKDISGFAGGKQRKQ